MMTLEIKSKVSKQGLRAGKTLYYAYPTKREKLRKQEVSSSLIRPPCSLESIPFLWLMICFHCKGNTNLTHIAHDTNNSKGKPCENSLPYSPSSSH